MPEAVSGHVLVMTSNGDNLLNCGGYPNFKQCYSLDIKEKRWIHHSNLTQERYFATSVTMPNGVYIFGGSNSPTTTDFLPKNSGVWQAVPSIIPNGFKWGCGVQISQEDLLLIGGWGTEDRLLEFNTTTNNFTIRGSKLQQGRRGHSCTLLNDTIIVAGGRSASRNVLNSTELVPLTNGSPRFGGDLNMARAFFGLATIGVQQKKAYSFGGWDSSYTDLQSVEEWDADTEQWKLATFSLKEAKWRFGYLAVPPQLVCPPNN